MSAYIIFISDSLLLGYFTYRITHSILLSLLTAVVSYIIHYLLFGIDSIRWIFFDFMSVCQGIIGCHVIEKAIRPSKIPSDFLDVPTLKILFVILLIVLWRLKLADMFDVPVALKNIKSLWIDICIKLRIPVHITDEIFINIKRKKREKEEIAYELKLLEEQRERHARILREEAEAKSQSQ